jgi:glycosyltransferase involved in cell wall biosynthesis
MELVAQKQLSIGRHLRLLPGDVFTVEYAPHADQLIREGKALPKTEPLPTNVAGMVSCIMPTRNRREWIPRAIASFNAQTYANKELIVLDNGESIEDLLPKQDNIRYVRLPGTQTTGQLRNICCTLAKGEYIAHWDDDDWSHPERLAEQVAALGDGHQVTGYNRMYFHGGDQVVLYVGAARYAVGTSLLYRRSYWDLNRFPPQKIGEDTAFVNRAANVLRVLDGTRRMVAATHPTNTSPRNMKGANWKPATAADLPEGYL